MVIGVVINGETALRRIPTLNPGQQRVSYHHPRGLEEEKRFPQIVI
jgi:hypothetical protein